MDKIKTKQSYIVLARALIFGFLVLMVIPPVASAIVRYGSSASLSTGDVSTAHILNGTILNADISSSALIDVSKLYAGIGQGFVFMSNGSTFATSSLVQFSTSTANYYFFSGRVHATSTNFNGVNQTWPSVAGASGDALTTNGAGVLSWASATGKSIIATGTAGTALSLNDALFIAATSSNSTTTIDALDATSVTTFGKDSTDGTQVATRIAESKIVNKIEMRIRKAGTPAGDAKCGIQADSSGSPSNTYLGSGTVAQGTITTTLANYVFVLDSAVKTTASPTMWVVCQSTGANSATDYYSAGYTDPSGYSDPELFSFRGSWGAISGTGSLDLTLNTNLTPNSLYPASAAIFDYSNGFIGFAQSATTNGAEATYVTAGQLYGLSGLTSGIQYYLSNTFGAVSSSAGTRSVKVGRPSSASDLVVLNNN